MDPELKALIAKIGDSAVVSDPPAALPPVCFCCKNPIDSPTPKIVRNRYGEQAAVHESCWEEYRAAQAQRDEEARTRALEGEVSELEKRFGYYMAGNVSGGDGYGVCHPPSWPYARFDNAEFRRRCSKRILTAVEKWDPNKLPTLLLCAPTGSGKTAGMVAWLWRYRDQQLAKVRAGEKNIRIMEFVFATGPELSVARRNASLGSEAPLIKHAISTPFLVIDELGFEKPSEVPFEIVDQRYRERGVTVVTTGLKANEFRARYGDAMFRRLTEGGAVVEDFPE